MQYTDTYNENIISFVNNVKTIDGGTHEVGFKTAITRVFNDYAKKNNYLKQKDKTDVTFELHPICQNNAFLLSF